MSKFSIGKKKDKEYVLSEETAREILVDELYKIDFDIDRLEETDPESAKNMETALNVILDYMRRGYIEFGVGDNIILQHRRDAQGEEKKTIEYKYLTPKDVAEIKAISKGKDEEAQAFILLGKASGFGDDIIRSMSKFDRNVASSLVLFLG